MSHWLPVCDVNLSTSSSCPRHPRGKQGLDVPLSLSTPWASWWGNSPGAENWAAPTRQQLLQPSLMLLLTNAHSGLSLSPCNAAICCGAPSPPLEPPPLAATPPCSPLHPALLSSAATPPRPCWYCMTAALLLLPAMRLLLSLLICSCPYFQQPWGRWSPLPSLLTP